MSNTMYQLVAVDEDKHPVQLINEDSDSEYLDRIADGRDGIIWIGSVVYDLKVLPA